MIPAGFGPNATTAATIGPLPRMFETNTPRICIDLVKDNFCLQTGEGGARTAKTERGNVVEARETICSCQL